VVLPSIFDLKTGMNILFFARQRPDDSVKLIFYLPIEPTLVADVDASCGISEQSTC